MLTECVLSAQDRVILDFYSFVNTVFGNQEGAEVGYNSMHPGKKSMHPLYVFEGISRLCLYAELRQRQSLYIRWYDRSCTEALRHVRSDVATMARFDKGFPNEKHLLFFEDYRDPDTGFPKEIPYVGKYKLYRNLVEKGLEKSWCRVL